MRNSKVELRFEYEPFKKTGVMVLRPADLVIEALDDNRGMNGPSFPRGLCGPRRTRQLLSQQIGLRGQW